MSPEVPVQRRVRRAGPRTQCPSSQALRHATLNALKNYKDAGLVKDGDKLYWKLAERVT